jgi:hypothetical protein
MFTYIVYFCIFVCVFMHNCMSWMCIFAYLSVYHSSQYHRMVFRVRGCDTPVRSKSFRYWHHRARDIHTYDIRHTAYDICTQTYSIQYTILHTTYHTPHTTYNTQHNTQHTNRILYNRLYNRKIYNRILYYYYYYNYNYNYNNNTNTLIGYYIIGYYIHTHTHPTVALGTVATRRAADPSRTSCMGLISGFNRYFSIEEVGLIGILV